MVLSTFPEVLPLNPQLVLQTHRDRVARVYTSPSSTMYSITALMHLRYSTVLGGECEEGPVQSKLALF